MVAIQDRCADGLARDAILHSDFACTFRKCQPNLLRYMRSKLRQCKFDLDIFLRQKRSAHGVLLRMSEYILYWGCTVDEVVNAGYLTHGCLRLRSYNTDSGTTMETLSMLSLRGSNRNCTFVPGSSVGHWYEQYIHVGTWTFRMVSAKVDGTCTASSRKQ